MTQYLKKIENFLAVGLMVSVLAPSSSALAKVRGSTTPAKSKSPDLNYVKGITGEARLTIREKITLPEDAPSFQFQDGKPTSSVEFYASPRCYLHLRNGEKETRELPSGQILKVSKIDNIYSKGTVHVTFWFDKDPRFSDLSCITNYNHTLNASELRSTLGNSFEISFSKSVETDALFNIAPIKGAPVLSESATTNGPVNAARVILSDS